MYASEKQNLNYISLEKESYRELLKYDYKLPPHEGRLFYRRFSFFSWHPRVDSDDPREYVRKFVNQKFFNEYKIHKSFSLFFNRNFFI